MPFLKRHVILWLTMFLARCKYYFGWLSCEYVLYDHNVGIYFATVISLTD